MQSLIVTIFVGLVAAANAQNIIESNNQKQRCGILVSGTVVADANDCSQYQVCNNGVLQLFKCPTSFSFSQTKKMCVYNLNCRYEDKEVEVAPINRPSVSNPCAGRLTGTNLPSPISCKQFYYCYQGETILKYCPVGYSYDSLKTICVLSTKQCV